MSTPLPRKRLDFKPGCMRGKSVRKVPGVGETAAQNLERAGFGQASDLKRKAQSLNFNKEKFQEWMKNKCGANMKNSSECFDFLLDWHRKDKKVVPKKQSLKVCKRLNIETMKQKYSTASSSTVCIYSHNHSNDNSHTHYSYNNSYYGVEGTNGAIARSVYSHDSLGRYIPGLNKKVHKRTSMKVEYQEYLEDSY